MEDDCSGEVQSVDDGIFQEFNCFSILIIDLIDYMKWIMLNLREIKYKDEK